MPDSAPLPIVARKANGAEPHVTTGSFPSSRKMYVAGRRHGDIRVAMREIDLEPSANEPAVRVYDTSGPYSDPEVTTDIHLGLAELRRQWILARGDVEEIEGREIKPEDNGLTRGEAGAVPVFDRARRKVLRGKPGEAVTQFAYAKRRAAPRAAGAQTAACVASQAVARHRPLGGAAPRRRRVGKFVV